MFLNHYGFDQKTTKMILPKVIIEKESVRFPFSFTQEEEIIFIDKSIKRAKYGLFVFDPIPGELKSIAYHFASVYEMLCFIDHNKNDTFHQCLFVVSALVLEDKYYDELKKCYPSIIKHNILISDNIRLIKLSSILSELHLKVFISDTKMIVQNERKNITYTHFRFSKYAKDFKIKPNIKRMNISKFLHK